MKKLILLIILSTSLYYYFKEDNTSNIIIKDEISNKTKVIYKKKDSMPKDKTKKIRSFNHENIEITSMMIHFFKYNIKDLRKKLSSGDFKKLSDLIQKKENKIEFNEKDILTLKYLDDKGIIRAIKLNNLSLIP